MTTLNQFQTVTVHWPNHKMFGIRSVDRKFKSSLCTFISFNFLPATTTRLMQFSQPSLIQKKGLQLTDHFMVILYSSVMTLFHKKGQFHFPEKHMEKIWEWMCLGLWKHNTRLVSLFSSGLPWWILMASLIQLVHTSWNVTTVTRYALGKWAEDWGQDTKSHHRPTP